MNTHRVQQHVVEGKDIFVGLEDSKRTWKLSVRCERMVIHTASMEAREKVLFRYLKAKFPHCVVSPSA